MISLMFVRQPDRKSVSRPQPPLTNTARRTQSYCPTIKVGVSRIPSFSQLKQAKSQRVLGSKPLLQKSISSSRTLEIKTNLQPHTKKPQAGSEFKAILARSVIKNISHSHARKSKSQRSVLARINTQSTEDLKLARRLTAELIVLEAKVAIAEQPSRTIADDELSRLRKEVKLMQQRVKQNGMKLVFLERKSGQQQWVSESLRQQIEKLEGQNKKLRKRIQRMPWQESLEAKIKCARKMIASIQLNILTERTNLAKAQRENSKLQAKLQAMRKSVSATLQEHTQTQSQFLRSARRRFDELEGRKGWRATYSEESHGEK